MGKGMKVPCVRDSPFVSVVITTRNEDRNIGNCLRSILAQTYPRDRTEIIVVDNRSSDRTKAIAMEFTDKVFDKGPERSAQRNYGIFEQARGEYVLFLDADMILAPTTLARGIECMIARGWVGVYISEIVLGRGILGRVRRFERSFYDGTVVDCVRLFERRAFVACGGFNTQMVGPEDWDLDKELRNRGEVGVLGRYAYADMDRFVRRHEPEELCRECFRGGVDAPVVFHNETDVGFRRYLSKKALYSPSYDLYMEKWGRNDPDVRKQLGLGYRYLGVFVEQGKWKRLLRYPLLAVGMYGLRICVGVVYLTRGLRRRSKF